MRITWNRHIYECGDITYAEFAAQQGILGALGAMVNGKTYSLSAKIESDTDIRILTYADEEGRRIYERSLQMLFLAAAHRVNPDITVRFEHSYMQGLYTALPGTTVTPDLIRDISREMRAIVDADSVIERLRIPTEEAKRLYADRGEENRLAILQYRSFDTITLYRLENELEYSYGEMVPSAGYIRVFALRPTENGILLDKPVRNDPSRPVAAEEHPKLLRTYHESAAWSRILHCSNVPDLNAMTSSDDIREFVLVNEGLHTQKVYRIADAFLQSGARILLIAGPSSSGKTTFAQRLRIALRVLGRNPVKLSLDDYYRNRDDLPLEADGKPDLESVHALDLPLLQNHLRALLRGETVQMPVFDFKTQRRSPETHPLHLEADRPILIEGIHALNPMMTDGIDDSLKFRVYISALTMLNLDDHNRIRTTDARLIRRIVRDERARGTSAAETLDMWDSVRLGEEKYIFPYQETADVMFNSSLDYELAVLKKYAYPLLCDICPEHPRYTMAQRLVEVLNYIRSANVEDEIPNDSILREFIGKSCFERE